MKQIPRDRSFTFTTPPGWDELQTEDDGRALQKKGRTNSLLQLSLSRNPEGATFEARKSEVAEKLVLSRGGRVTHTSEGEYGGGTYGRVIFNGERLAHGEAWVLSDGASLFLATYTSEKAPDRQELQDVANIITSVRWKA
jgi:hypothetical protein